MDQKGAIDLSVNTLVVVIIGLVILGAGITFLYQLIAQSTELKAKLDQQTEEQLKQLLIDQGRKVAISVNTATVLRGESRIFGVGILNVGEEDFFTIDVSLSKFVNEENQEATTDDLEIQTKEWLFYSQEQFSLGAEGNHNEAIMVNIPKNVLTGQYLFNVRVFDSEGQYGNTQKFVITVK